MSIKLLARDLYRLQKEVERLEERLAAARIEERSRIEEALRKLRAEREHVRRALDGQIGR
jgi:predicted nuclease with TOPRIM domain